MSVVLFVLSILAAAGGATMIGFGIPINEFTLGSTLIHAGAIALATGLVLFGLGAAVRELGRLADAMRVRPAPRIARPIETAETAVSPQPASPPAPVARPSPPPPPRPPLPRQPPAEAVPPEPRPGPALPEPNAAEAAAAPPPLDFSAAAIDRLRSSLPRLDRGTGEPPVVAEADVPLSPREAPRPSPGPNEPAAEPAGPSPAATESIEPVIEARLEFLRRSKAAGQRPLADHPVQAEIFDALWPDRARRPRPAQNQPGPASESQAAANAPSAGQGEGNGSVPSSAREPSAPPATPPAEERPVGILKSGVVDGMAYTLYADGSIEAKLPQGTVRFGSINELRQHIENNS